MGRRKKIVNIDERIAIAEEEEAVLAAQLREKQEEIEALKAEKMEQDQKQLVQLMNESGLSVDDVSELIRKNTNL